MPKAPRRSDVLGEYAPDRFMITLSAVNPIVDPTTFKLLPLDEDRLSVLFHEYVHYLQNIASIAGYHSFRRALSLWWIFTETVDPDGVSKGSDSLTPERAEWVAQYLAIAKRFDGEDEAHVPSGFEIDSFRIAQVNRTPLELPLGAETTLITQVDLSGEASDRTGTKIPFTYHFGTIAIMEGVAYGLDRIVASGIDVERNPGDDAPPFPYRALRQLVTHLIPAADPLSILRLGCLSLNSNDPAGALLDLCELASARLASGMTLPVAIEDISNTCSNGMRALAEAVLTRDIPEHEAAFGTVGTLNKALSHVHALFTDNLTVRKANPFLELPAFTPEGRVDYDAVRGLFARHPPCVILQENHGSENVLQRDFLTHADDQGYALRDEMAVLHCALHFLIAHLNFLAQNITETESIDPWRCPFYTACALPLRRQAPGICKSRPWKAYRWKGWATEEQCWYGAAVASSARRKSD